MLGEEVFEEIAGRTLGVERGQAHCEVVEVGLLIAGVLGDDEPHRKCREAGATATSSAGVALTCRTYAKDGRLRWLAAGE